MIDKSILLAEGLEVDEQRMLRNLEATNGLIYAEEASLQLAAKMGKAGAHAFVEACCRIATEENRHLKEVLTERTADISPEELHDLFRPENAIGSSLEIIDEILKHYEDAL